MTGSGEGASRRIFAEAFSVRSVSRQVPHPHPNHAAPCQSDRRNRSPRKILGMDDESSCSRRGNERRFAAHARSRGVADLDRQQSEERQLRWRRWSVAG